MWNVHYAEQYQAMGALAKEPNMEEGHFCKERRVGQGQGEYFPTETEWYRKIPKITGATLKKCSPDN